MAAYLQEIKALPLLSQQEEAALCKEILEYEQYKAGIDQAMDDYCCTGRQ